jgi:ribokinase
MPKRWLQLACPDVKPLSPQAFDVVVVGSLNVDYRVEIMRRPAPGETVLGGDVQRLSGGKGANQAVGVASAGGACALVGCAGDDADGDLVLDALRARGVDVSGVVRAPDVRTGNAFIFVTPDGENTIVVASGANHRVDAASALEAIRIAAPAVVLLQGELAVDTTADLLAGLRHIAARVVVNLAPVIALPAEAISGWDTLVVNAGEAAQLLGVAAVAVADAERAAAALRDRARQAVVTLGPNGAVGADARGTFTVPAPRVEAVDTTGAGDAFAGALAFRIARGQDLRPALEGAVAAGAHAVGYAGAQPPAGDR